MKFEVAMWIGVDISRKNYSMTLFAITRHCLKEKKNFQYDLQQFLLCLFKSVLLPKHNECIKEYRFQDNIQNIDISSLLLMTSSMTNTSLVNETTTNNPRHRPRN